MMGYLKRNDMSQVMANSGFGKCVIDNPNGVRIIASQKAITTKGRLRAYVVRLLSNLTIDAIETLKVKYGVEVIIANAHKYICLQTQKAKTTMSNTNVKKNLFNYRKAA